MARFAEVILRAKTIDLDNIIYKKKNNPDVSLQEPILYSLDNSHKYPPSFGYSAPVVLPSSERTFINFSISRAANF